jgi:plasmid stabilization system protein ParE
MVVKFTVSARAHFLAAIEFSRQKSPTAAQQFRQRAGKSLKRLDRFSGAGAVVAEFPKLPYREVYVAPYPWHGVHLPALGVASTPKIIPHSL